MLVRRVLSDRYRITQEKFQYQGVEICSPGDMKSTGMLVIAGLENVRLAMMACDLLNIAVLILMKT